MEQQEKIEQIAEEKVSMDATEKIKLIKNQWIPDIEKTIPEVLDEELRGAFTEELSGIKNDFTLIETANFVNEEIKEKIKNVYERAEDLFGKIALCFEKKKGEEE